MSFFQNHSGWPLVPLKNIATLKRGYDLPVGSRNEGAVPIYAANGKNGAHDEVKIKGPGVITGRSGTIGKVHYCEEGFWPLNTALYVMDFHGNHPRWVYYMLSAFKLERFSEGAGVPTLNRNLVHDELIPLPPLPEQKRIAAILDKADAIRRKRQQAIQLADDFLRAVFLDMFGDPVTNPKGLDITSIGKLCDVATGATPPRGGDEYYGGDIPWVKTGEVDGYVIYKTEENITSKALSISNCKLNPVGSIVMAMYGQGKTRGKVGVLGVEAATNQACAVIKPSSKIMMEYLYFYLKISYEALRSLGQGAGQPNLNLSIVKGFPVLLPSEVDQMRFLKVSESVGNFSKRSLSAIQDSSEFFKALSQKAFSGEL